MTEWSRWIEKKRAVRAGPGIALLLLLLLLTACGEEVAVIQRTRVFVDGSLWRAVEVFGRDGNGEAPEDAAWLADKIGLLPAEPDAWGRVEEQPGHLAFEGQFLDARAVPPSLAHDTEAGVFVDRADVELQQEDLVVLQRWIYRETLGDPFAATDVAAVLDELERLVLEVLEQELRLEFRDAVDPSRASAFVSGDARALLDELFAASKRMPGGESSSERARTLARILDRRDIGVAENLDGAKDWGQALDRLLDPVIEWASAGVADALSTSEHPVTADQLDFWPSGDDLRAWLVEPADDPRQERLMAIAESLLRTVTGYYGDEGAPRFRFTSELELPGRLIRTNGTPTERGIVHWLHRSEDLATGLELRAESVELRLDALVSLGARRSFDTVQLLRLTDLLGERIPEVLPRLAEAVREGDLGMLVDADEVPTRVRELYELLDPGEEPWPSR